MLKGDIHTITSKQFCGSSSLKKNVANEGQMLQQVWLYENQMQTKRCTYIVLGVNIATIHRKKVCIICEIYRHFGLKLPYSKAGS